ncbi:MAG TPA: Tic20 family protein [Candidatus Obscuribacterales bacterium]
MTWRSSTTTVSDRIFACLPYLLPLIEGLTLGRFIFAQFPALQVVLIPIFPILQLYSSIPFAGLIIFFALLLLVVRNPSISHFIRFNTMQAIMIDIIIIVSSLILSLLGNGLSTGLIGETVNNVLFLGMIAAVGYSVVQSALGRYAEIPTISDAVNLQVR